MDAPQVRTKIKEIISTVSGIPAEEIADNASYQDDLDLDSLTLLEIGVDVDYEFKLGLPEDQLQQIRSVQDAVDIVLESLAQREKVA
ncbi:MAG: acyl carrier protein [Acidobacteriota bacterium]